MNPNIKNPIRRYVIYWIELIIADYLRRNGYKPEVLQEQVQEVEDGHMINNPIGRLPSDYLKGILPTRLSNALKNRLYFKDKWLNVETIGELTDVINTYGFSIIEDCKNVGSKGVAEIARLYDVTVDELVRKNPKVGYWHKDFKIYGK